MHLRLLPLSRRHSRWALRLLTTLVACLATSPALATDRYVDSGASCPGSGTSGSPYCSFSSINSLDLAPGDRVLLKRGATFNVSTGPSLILGNEDDGSSVSWNSVEPYGSGADPIITGASVADTKGIDGTDLDYWKFIEIEFKNASDGIYVSYKTLTHTGLRFDKLYFHDMVDTDPWSGHGIYIETPSKNLAEDATATASSTDPLYCLPCVNDGNPYDWNGWASGDNVMPEWVQLDLTASQTVARVEFDTNGAYPTRDFQVQHWNGSSWATDATVTGNTQKHRTITFSPVTTQKIRIYVTLGDAATGYARIEEIKVYDDTYPPVPGPTQWVLKDIQVTDSEFGPIGLYLAIDGVLSTKLETFQDIVFLRNYVHDVKWDMAFRYNKNVKWIDNRNERIASGSLGGTTDLHLWAVSNATFANSLFDYVYDVAGAHDETFGDLAYRLDQTRFRNNLFEDAAGTGMEWHAWRTGDDYGLDPTANTYTNQEVSGNVFRNNGWDTTPMDPHIYEGSLSVNDILGCYTTVYGTVSDNLYWEPTGFLNTNGCAHSLTLTNNRSIDASASLYHAGQTFSDASCSTSPWSYESSTNGTSWTAMSTLSTVNPKTDVRCKPSAASVPWVNRFEAFPNTGTSYTVARTWTAPSAGTISIRSRALKAELGGDGVNVRVTKNGTAIIGPTALGASDQVGVVLNADTVQVNAGDKIRFEVDDKTGNTSDRISWSPAVAFRPSDGGNLGLTATVTASSTNPSYCTCRANNGDTADWDGWSAADGVMPEWLQLDWASAQTVGRVEFWTTGGGYETRDFQVQYWNGSAWITPSGWSVTGNNQKHRTFTIVPAVSTQKIRVYITLGDPLSGGARIDELEVYASANLALSASTFSASTTHPSYCACRINDGNTADYNGWASADLVPVPHWVELDWAASQTVGRVELYTTGAYPTPAFQVQYWNGSAWVTPSGWSVSGNTLKHLTFSISPAVSTTKIRVYVTTGDAFGVGRVDELEVYPSPNLAPVATVSASTTHPSYCTCRVSNGLTADFDGWASADLVQPPHWLELDWTNSQTVGRVELDTTGAYPTRDFQIQHWNGSAWVTDATITGNTLKHRTITFTAVSTLKLRVYITLGDIYGVGRVDELEVYRS